MAVITIGAAATDRADYSSGTNVNIGGPADGTGTITSIEIWITQTTTIEAATFIDEGSNVLSTRDYESLGSVTGGSKQTISGLSIDVQTGDYIGSHGSFTFAGIEYDTSGGSGKWRTTGDSIPASSVTFTLTADAVVSLYGTGETAPEIPTGTVHLNKTTGEHTQDTGQTPLRYNKATGEVTTLSTVSDYLVLDKATGKLKSSAT